MTERGALTMPALALAGARNRYATLLEPMMREVARRVAFVLIPEAGHWLPEENPQAVSIALADFIGAG